MSFVILLTDVVEPDKKRELNDSPIPFVLSIITKNITQTEKITEARLKRFISDSLKS